MENAPFFIAFSLGLASTLHCLGMCGGIISALSIANKAKDTDGQISKYLKVLGYNLGRIFSYSIAGIVAGFMGMLFVDSFEQEFGYKVLQIVASLFLILLGLHIAGWFPHLKKIEQLGTKIWHILQPIGKLFLPVDNWFKSLILGAIWGWLPCGLVYSVLLWTVTAADPVSGGLYMLSFGLGTLPGMIAAGLISSQMTLFFNRPYIKQVMGLFLITFAVLLLLPSSHNQHHSMSEGSPGHHHAH